MRSGVTVASGSASGLTETDFDRLLSILDKRQGSNCLSEECQKGHLSHDVERVPCWRCLHIK
jgi:hypothetical protein